MASLDEVTKWDVSQVKTFVEKEFDLSVAEKFEGKCIHHVTLLSQNTYFKWSSGCG